MPVEALEDFGWGAHVLHTDWTLKIFVKNIKVRKWSTNASMAVDLELKQFFETKWNTFLIMSCFSYHLVGKHHKLHLK